MAPIPRVKSLKREDYPQAPAWFDQLLLVLNQQAGDVSQALSNGLTQTENGRAEFKTVDVVMPLEFPTWRVVGQPGQPAFENGMGNWSAGFPPIGFRMMPDGFVELHGFGKTGGTPPAAYTNFTTVPPGYRPWRALRFTSMHSTGVVTIHIDPDGGLKLAESSPAIPAGMWFQLDGIRWQAYGPAARVESFGAPFPLSVRLTNKWPVKTCDVVSVFDVTGQQPGTVGPVTATWNTREAGMLTLEALWGLQPGRSYKVTLLVTAG